MWWKGQGGGGRVSRTRLTDAKCKAGPFPKGSPADPEQLINGLFVWRFKKALLTQVHIYTVGLI